MKNNKKHWYDYLWIVTPIYFTLGFFNIMFAWIGMIFFCLPLIISIFGGGKLYCNRYCDRGQFFSLLGGRLGISFNRPTPKFISSKIFRYGFLIFFFVMFFQMLFTTYLVGAGAKDLGEFIKILWTFKLPWHRSCIYDIFQTQKLVCILSHGHHDTAHKQTEGKGA